MSTVLMETSVPYSRISRARRSSCCCEEDGADGAAGGSEPKESMPIFSSARSLTHASRSSRANAALNFSSWAATAATGVACG